MNRFGLDYPGLRKLVRFRPDEDVDGGDEEGGGADDGPSANEPWDQSPWLGGAGDYADYDAPRKDSRQVAAKLKLVRHAAGERGLDIVGVWCSLPYPSCEAVAETLGMNATAVRKGMERLRKAVIAIEGMEPLERVRVGTPAKHSQRWADEKALWHQRQSAHASFSGSALDRERPVWPLSLPFDTRGTGFCPTAAVASGAAATGAFAASLVQMSTDDKDLAADRTGERGIIPVPIAL